MATALYISNEGLAAVSGKVRGERILIKQYAKASLPPGTVLGGIVTGEAAFSEAVRQLSEQFPGGLKNVRLVFDSSQIYLKRGTVPKMSKKRILAWEESEFSEVDAEDDVLLYDCMPLKDLGPERGGTALLCAARRNLVAGYAERMNGLKIRMAGLEPTVSALQKLLRCLEETRNATCVVLSMDGSMLDASLFLQGEYRINNRTRLIASRGTPESLAEISRMVSGILQFNLSERSGQSVSQILVIGSKPEENGMFRQIEETFDLPAKVLTADAAMVTAPDGDFVFQEYAYAVGALMGA